MKIYCFMRYSKGMYGDEECLYNAGLELFENVSEHDNITALRNYIDHFVYFSGGKNGRSMLDIYSEVFDRFFTYDMKYRKNVPNMLYNILLRHFVVASFKFSTGEKRIGYKDKEKIKESAQILLREKGGLASDKFTFKLAEGTTIELTAKSTSFLMNVANILYYPEKAPLEIARESEKLDDKETEKSTNVTNASDGIGRKNIRKGKNKKR